MKNNEHLPVELAGEAGVENEMGSLSPGKAAAPSGSSWSPVGSPCRASALADSVELEGLGVDVSVELKNLTGIAGEVVETGNSTKRLRLVATEGHLLMSKHRLRFLTLKPYLL